jgi:transcriptional regulator with XRE-family HTH domain
MAETSRGEKAMTGQETDKKKIEETGAESVDRKEMGARLREAREYVGLSQDEVAKYLSIPRTALSHIETGQRRIDALELQKLAQLYKRPIGYFTGEEKVDAELPEYVARLTHAAAGLSARDRAELSRFAEFLRAKAQMESDPNG